MRGFESARPEAISPPLGAFELGPLEPRLVKMRPQIKLMPLQNVEDGFGEPDQPFIQVLLGKLSNTILRIFFRWGGPLPFTGRSAKKSDNRFTNKG